MNETFSLARDRKLRRVRKDLERFARNSIRIELQDAYEVDSLPIGRSKLGGLPDLPPGTEWPSYVPSLEKDSRNPDGAFYIPFLGQFNMSELAPYDLDSVLPKTGFIYFFYIFDPDQFGRGPDPFGINPRLERLNGIKVFYHDIPISQLERREYPQASHLEESRAFSNHEANIPFKYKASSLKFSTERLLPTVEIEDIMRSEEFDHWLRLTYARRANHPIHHMLGYPDLYSHPPCIPVELFVPEVIQFPYDVIDELRVLLQIHWSVEDAINFPAGARRYIFFMRERHLKVRDFSRVWVDVS